MRTPAVVLFRHIDADGRDFVSLSFARRRENKSPDFDGLLAAWLAALDAEELNKRFYRKLLA